uniref:anaerobic sulfatase-maturation protein n=1 Tax=Alistipes sp. TaxID=1872444 RepID=UPI004055A6CA
MAREGYLTYEEILKRDRPRAFGSMVKPVGSRCNLDCHYCYYLDKESLYGGEEPTMSVELLERYIRQYIEGNRVDCVSFTWHGGEPMLAGPEFFRHAIALQKRYAKGKRIENALQTNGLLLNEEWCQFLKENNFLVGISIDGPQSIHDANRLDKGGMGSFDRVMRGVELLRRNGVEFNTMTTVNRASEGRGREVYRFLKSIGSHYMQFMPVVEYTLTRPDNPRPYIVPPHTPQSVLAPWSVSAKGYGDFMCDIFDEWVIQDVGRYYVQLFDVALAQWVGMRPALCSFCDTCGDSLVVEHNGDIYSCDHFVYPEHRLGNLRDTTLKEAYASRRQADFGAAKHNRLPEECRHCRYYFACRGECPKHRFDTTPEQEPDLNTLCEGYKRFFSHVDPYMRYMAELLRSKRAPAWVMPWARQRMGL